MAANSLESLVTSIEVEREQALKSKERAASEIQAILRSAKKDDRRILSGEEEAQIQREFKNHEQAERDIAGIDIKLANARKLQRIEMETDLKLRDTRDTDPGPTGGRDDMDVQNKRRGPSYDEVARIGQEKRTYNPGNCRKGSEFLQDVIASYAHHDAEADHRLRAHMREERVERGEYLQKRANVGTSNFAGLVVPQYLTDLYAPAVAALRPRTA